MLLLSTLTKAGLAAICLLSSTTLAAPRPKKPAPDPAALKGNCIVNLAFANSNNVAIPGLTAADVIGNLSKISPKPSAIVPLLYNTDLTNDSLNPEISKVLEWLAEKAIPFYPAVDLAEKSAGILNTTTFAQIVSGYAQWTNRIQIGAANTVYYPTDPQGFTDTLNWLSNSLGFSSIQLNGWPKNEAHGGLVPFTNPAINSVWLQTSNETWTVNTQYLPKYFALRPNMNVMANYENPTQQTAIAKLSVDAQKAVFQKTIDSIQNTPYGTKNGGNNTLHWTLPWSQNYSPQAQGTWNFALQSLAGLNGLLGGLLGS